MQERAHTGCGTDAMLDGFSAQVSERIHVAGQLLLILPHSTDVYGKMITFRFGKALWIPAFAGMTSGV